MTLSINIRATVWFLAVSFSGAWGPPASAQAVPIRGQIVPTAVSRTTITNNYIGSPYGYPPPANAYSCTGCFPGAGPYDSAIAVAGIAAGASVLNTLIGAAIQRPAQVVINQVGPIGATPAPAAERLKAVGDPRATAGCTLYMSGQSTTDGPLYITVCR